MTKKEIEKRALKYMASWNSKDPAKVLKFFATKSNFVDPANPKGCLLYTSPSPRD